MKTPGFTAEVSISGASGTYSSQATFGSDVVVTAQGVFCKMCDIPCIVPDCPPCLMCKAMFCP
ncbi:MAG: hypothetical protein SFH39_16890 [Candidatus Magnetobacterium sp. LHC-1]|uniref:Uncharacterized protein n=1 Tax=Candidatus Magnetobacterium casense TaxID=1455061 RepID=A0ABS6RZV9_9BACT|nr:hypothetical protein [Candidatus Magnetobacterium casensis]MBF0608368.1 hypothetical protein [Nitrospirota bacterium]MBV6342096.1 hypothetical protein [Candidatus Magnetobacterium casensis]